MRQPSRVELVISRDDVRSGGSLRVAETLALGLRARGVDAEITVAYGPAGPLTLGGRVPTHLLGLDSSRHVRRWPRWRARLAERRPDVVHLVDVMAWPLLAGLGRMPVVVAHVHGRPRDPTVNSVPMTLGTRLHRRALRARIDAYACITEGARLGMIRTGLAPASRAFVVPNAVEHDRLQARPGREEARAALGLPQDRPIFGMVCRIVDGRGIDTALRMLALMPGWHAAFVGDGPHRRALEALAGELGVGDRAHFVGPLSDVRPAFAALDAFVYLARYESFGLAIAEAMACDVPVFGLHSHGEYAEGPQALVTPSTATFLPRKDLDQQAPDDPAEIEQLAAVLRHFEKEPAEFRARSAAAASHVRDRFSISAQADAIMDVYRFALGWR